MANYAKDTEFQPTGIAGPLIFMFLFILFVYGALWIGSMGVANTLIHYYHLEYFMKRGVWGAAEGAALMLAAWSLLACFCAFIPYLILRLSGKEKTARLTGQAVLILMFHVFAMPVILWVMIRKSSPALRARRVQKLRRLAQARRAARRPAKAAA